MERHRRIRPAAKLLLILLRHRWEHALVDPLRPHGIYPPWGFFFTRSPLLYSRVTVTSGFLAEPSDRTVMRIVSASREPISRPKTCSISAFA